MHPFDALKTVQAAAVLLKRAPRCQMPYLQLLKLLYIADRESLRVTMRPILGGPMVAMKKGPLHSKVYDLIKGNAQSTDVWSRFTSLEEYDVELVNDPGDSELSDEDVELLTEVSEKYGKMTGWQLVDLTHKFPEWIKNYPDPSQNTSRRIHIHDILDAVGYQDHGLKKSILTEIHKEEQERTGFLNSLACTRR